MNVSEYPHEIAEMNKTQEAGKIERVLPYQSELRWDYFKDRQGFIEETAVIKFPIEDEKDRYNPTIHAHVWHDLYGQPQINHTLIVRAERRDEINSHLEAWETVNDKLIRRNNFPALPYEDPAITQISEDKSILSGVRSQERPDGKGHFIWTNYHLVHHDQGRIIHVDRSPLASIAGLKDNRLAIAYDPETGQTEKILVNRGQGLWPHPDYTDFSKGHLEQAKKYGKGRIGVIPFENFNELSDPYLYLNANGFPKFQTEEWGGANAVYPLAKTINGQRIWGILGHHSSGNDQTQRIYDVTTAEISSIGRVHRAWQIELIADHLPQTAYKQNDLQHTAFPGAILPLAEDKAFYITGKGDTSSVVAKSRYPFSDIMLTYHDLAKNQRLFDILSSS